MLRQFSLSLGDKLLSLPLTSQVSINGCTNPALTPVSTEDYKNLTISSGRQQQTDIPDSIQASTIQQQDFWYSRTIREIVSGTQKAKSLYISIM